MLLSLSPWANITLDNMYEEIKTLEMCLNLTKRVRSSYSYLKHVRLCKLNHVFFQGAYGFSRPQLNRLYIHGMFHRKHGFSWRFLQYETIFIDNMSSAGLCAIWRNGSTRIYIKTATKGTQSYFRAKSINIAS